MWEFAETRQRAISQMSNLGIDAVDKIVLARVYHVPQWLIPALNEYTQRRKPITVADVHRLDLNYALKIVHSRETMQPSLTLPCARPGCRAPVTFTADSEINRRQSCDFTKALRSAFRDEIKRIETSSPSPTPFKWTHILRRTKSTWSFKGAAQNP
jgi:hypothetical protein